MRRDVLFRERLRVYQEGREKKEYMCEVVKREEGIEIRMYDQIDIFNILLFSIEEREYQQMKEAQGIRVDYFVFQRKIVEMLQRVGKEELLLSVGQRKAVIFERSDFRNIVYIELPLSPMPDTQIRLHVSEIIREMQMSNAKSERECTILRDEARRKEQAYTKRISMLEEQLERIEKEHRESSTREKDIQHRYSTEITEKEMIQADLERYKVLYEKAIDEAKKNSERIGRAAESEGLLREKERRCAILEEDLRKANEIIKRNFEEIKERKRAEISLSNQVEEERAKKEEVETKVAQLEVDLIEKCEEIKMQEEMEKERKEAIESLKAMNRSLSKKLESAYRVYSRIYGRTEKVAEEEESTRTDETGTTSSLIVPESINY